MLKKVFAGLLIVHGVIHAMGTAWAWDLAEIDGLGGPTLLFEGRAQGDPTIAVLGGLWLIATIGFIAAGVGVARGSAHWMPTAGVAAAISLIVTVVWWNDARVGAIVSALVLVVVIVRGSMEDIPEPEPQPNSELFVPQWWRSTL